MTPFLDPTPVDASLPDDDFELRDILREDCPECGGEGFRTQVRGTGMHAVEFDQTCGYCHGTGQVEVP